ncbi:hypothetical protein M3201_09775 [Paenibacillus motobuensis]|nr:hypothetical protein [Paenibacillus lutimineralis]MCM3647086.1 hypothetical protein [Paenibacillus motobuensis]
MICAVLLVVIVGELTAILWLAASSGKAVPEAISYIISYSSLASYAEGPGAELMAHFFVSISRLGIIFAMFLIARAIFKDISKEYTPFIAIHTKRLHAISILMIGLAIVPGVVEIIMIQLVQPTIKTNVSFELSYLVVAVIFFCLAQIFDYGRLLQQQSDETL